MKRIVAIVLIFCMSALLFGNKLPDIVVAEAANTSLRELVDKLDTDEITKQELSEAIVLGIIPKDMSLKGNITPKQLLSLLNNIIKLAGGDPVTLTKHLVKDYKSQTYVNRTDGACAFYLAAQAMGIDTHYANEAGLDRIDSYNDSENRLLKSLNDSYIVTDDYEKTKYSAIVCVGWFVTSQGSLITNRPIMTSDSNRNFNMGNKLSQMDAVLGAWRLYTSIEPDPNYLTVQEAKKLSYDKKIITDDIIKKSNDLPEISYENIPLYNAMCYLLKESAYQRCGNGWFTEDSVRALAKAGFNFLSVRYDFSVLNYPDYDSHKINLYELQQIDQLIAWGIEYGVHICIEGNGLPNQGGYPRGLHKYGMDTQEDALTSIFNGDKSLQKEFQSYWEVLASRYAKIPTKYLSFNLLVEISSPDEETYVNTFLPVAKAIRSYNNDRVVFSYANVNTVFAGLAAYGYPLAWSNFYPDMYTQIGLTDTHPQYDHVWKNWFLNGCLGFDAEGPKKLDIKLNTDITTATFYLCSASSYIWNAQLDSSPSKFSVSADGNIIESGMLPLDDDWHKYTIKIPKGTSTLTLSSEVGGGYLSFDGIILAKENGTKIKIVPTTYDYPEKSVPSSIVSVTKEGNVSTDVPITFDLLLARNQLSDYLEIAENNKVGIIVAEWGPVASSRNDTDALEYFSLCAKGYRKLGITAAPSRSPGFSFSTIVHKTELPKDYTAKLTRYVPVGNGSDYYIDTLEVKALTGKTYK